jgi:hypothetical protein
MSALAYRVAHDLPRPKSERCPNQPDGEDTHGPATFGPFARRYCRKCSDDYVLFLARIGAITTQLRSRKWMGQSRKNGSTI